MIPKNITEQHVLQALQDIDANGVKYPLTQSRKFDLVFKGKTYPPKYTISIANEIANNEYLTHTTFNTYEAQDFLKSLSPHFLVVKKNEVDPVLELIEKYKKHTKENRLAEEVYKWKLLGQFRGKPDLNATDFLAEIKSINYANLIYPIGVGVIHHLAKDRSEPYRACFKVLFDESLPLINRVKYFNEETLKIYRELVPEIKFQHHQDERTIGTFLTFHNPDKYTFFKDSFYQKYCKLIGIQAKKKGEKYDHYLELVEEFITEYINDDKELLELIKELIPSDAFQDSHHRLLAQDILYYVLDKGIDEIDIENASVYKISMGDFTKEEIESSIKEKKIVVHGDTKAKGQSQETQGVTFASKLNIGDYFYLTYGNGTDCIKLIGRITGEAVPAILNDYGDEGWLERSFEFITSSKKKSKYNGIKKWWTPNDNSTCIKIKSGELEEANKILFEPYFMTRFINNSEGINSNSDDLIKNLNNMEINNIQLNQILFGPPGTGKTYNTINKALQIINEKEEKELDWNDRTKVKALFDKRMEEGRIVFTTFHQSMSYEDFIEGIKPIDNNGTVTYEIVDGIFKKLCYETLFSIYDDKRDYEEGDKPQNYKQRKERCDEYFWDWEVLKNDGYLEATRRVIIIDEINRGNISQIFGELITLIEEDKRLGKDEALTATLPYSKNKFGVPPNLYIIGTMNTADRSVEALDAALRRRFSFEEIQPKAGLIDESLIRKYTDMFVENYDLRDNEEPWASYENNFISLLNNNKAVYEAMDYKPLQKIIEKVKSEKNFINVKELFENEKITFLPSDVLNIINKRIEKLLDKDHQIGHSYMMCVSNIEGLKSVFQNKIIPLLQEYFFGDYGKIGLVLGKDFFEEVKKEEENIFADFDDYDTSEPL